MKRACGPESASAMRGFRLPVLLSALVSGMPPAQAWADRASDEPGLVDYVDAPGIHIRPGPADDVPAFRLELGGGLSSLLVDPDVKAGAGGGIYLAYGLNGRFGAELTIFLSQNRYGGELGNLGNPLLDAFWAGNISLGPILQLTRPGARLSVTVDLGLGVYVVASAIQDLNWTLGISGGMTFGLHVTRWFGVGLKLRYHLFNLATIAGNDLIDRKSLRELGVIDRFELPGYIAFYF